MQLLQPHLSRARREDMHDDEKSPGQWLKKLRNDRGLSYRQMEDRADHVISYTTIRNLENMPGTWDKVEARTLDAIAKGLGVSASFIMQIALGATPEVARQNLERTGRFEHKGEWIEFPVHGVVSAGAGEGESVIDEDTAFIPVHKLEAAGIQDHSKVRIYRVNGNCMISEEARRSERSITHGDVIAIDTGRMPEAGDIVVAYWPDEDKLIVKRYKVENQNIVLYPAAPGHPMVVLPGEDSVNILGRVFYRGG